MVWNFVEQKSLFRVKKIYLELQQTSQVYLFMIRKYKKTNYI